MFDLLLSKTLEFFISLGYPGLFVVALGFPLPTEIIIAVLATAQNSNIWIISLVSSMGGVIGGLLTYLLGYLFTVKNPDRWFGGKSKLLKLNPETIQKSREKILKKGFFYAFFTRAIPWLRVPASLAAGFFRMNFVIYTLAIFLGGYVYSFVIAYLGSKMGKEIISYLKIFDKWILVIFFAYLGISTGYKNRDKIAHWIISLKKK